MSGERILTNIQEDLVARLGACPFFTDIPVITERREDVAGEVEKALGTITEKGGKMGICVVVQSPTASDAEPNVPVVVPEIELSFLVLESVLFNMMENGTQKEALTVAMAVGEAMKMYTAGGLCHALSLVKPGIVAVKPPKKGQVAYEVRFVTQAANAESTPKVATPVISMAGEGLPKTVTIVCGTSGATIYYTVDGKPPYKGGSTVQTYAAPFEVATACMVRAGAWKSDCICSNTAVARVA